MSSSKAAPKPNTDDYKLKDTKPELGEKWPHGGQRGGTGWIYSERATSTYDLVEQMYYLYVRVVKAKELPPNPVTGNVDPYVEVKVGNYKGKTRHFEKKTNPEWKQVFAFSKEKIQSSVVEVFVRDKEMVARDDYIGKVEFDMHEVPTRVPPDSPLAPQWYRLENLRGETRTRGEVMLAVWMGTQADEAFPEAWHSDSASVKGEGVYNIRSKVYVNPKLWYLRVNVIEAQDVEPPDKTQPPQVFVKAQVGQQVLKTKLCPTKTPNPMWNEDLVFVAAEPFEEQLVLTVENKASPGKDEVVAKLTLALNKFETRMDHRPVHSRWYNVERYGFGVLEGDKGNELKFSSRIHLRVCLEGAYHVLDESTMYISDTRTTARQLWKQPIGILEVGILSAQGLTPMKTSNAKSSTDAYCVAKYGMKWVRTRTITESFNPKWNEQYTWEVHDPCTVITFGVFDNCHLGGGNSQQSTTKTNDARIVNQLDSLRYQAMSIVAVRLGRAEPPLRKEVVEYMLDVDSHIWSLRRSKANFFRIVSLFSGLMSMSKWLGEVQKWKNPVTSILVHVLFFILICYPELILPTVFLYMFLIGVWNFRKRSRHPPHMDTKISWAEGAHPDELDEEFDTFPTSKAQDVIRMRYDRLRSVAGRIQTVVGDIATQGERLQALLSWRDPRATFLFVIFCLVTAVALYVTPFKMVISVAGIFWLRHPKFRSKLPSVPSNFFKRLPSGADSML
ncbi:FT-interacting protein 1 [Lathyrus oleraceus]|uniref:FT-interacting protein 1 n=1 Tax=Pisum sativum TaxID=3888 RepID=A0A9D4W975_PEA|nr:FT-interacting protein 1 [Pisum sativum]